MKLGIISIALPPSQSGQSVALFHLLKRWKPDTYFLITQKNFHGTIFRDNCSEKLPGKYYFLHPDIQILQRIIRAIIKLHLERLFDIILRFRIRQIKKVLKHEACDLVVACTGDIFDPPAAFYASKDLGIPFILYAFDYYSHQWTEPHYRSFAEKFEKKILLEAHHIIVPNECMEKEYHLRYGIRSVVIHNPLDIEEYEQNAILFKQKTENGASLDNIQIIYTGAIYDPHYSAFRNLVAAIQITHIENLHLHIYTPQSPGKIKAQGITGQVIFHKSLPNKEIPWIQRSADILFLPLAFNSDFPTVIRTSAPGKIGEYLASGRPILVHAPADSFVAWYFRKYSCGYVVDQDDPEVLAQAIIHLLRDKMLRKELTDNAYIRAKKDFDITIAQNRFSELTLVKKIH